MPENVGPKKMFNQNNAKVAVLESKLDMYEELSREMLDKLEAAVEKISEGNNRIAQILTKHDERLEQNMKTDSLILKMIDEMKDNCDKEHGRLSDRIDKIQDEIKVFSKFKWQAGAVLAASIMIFGAAGRILPLVLTHGPGAARIENVR